MIEIQSFNKIWSLYSGHTQKEEWYLFGKNLAYFGISYEVPYGRRSLRLSPDVDVDVDADDDVDVHVDVDVDVDVDGDVDVDVDAPADRSCIYRSI